MHELRKDPIIGRWVIIAMARARRPGTFLSVNKSNLDLAKDKNCPFCEGHEQETPPEIYAIRDQGSKPNTPGWKLRVVPDKNPILEAFVNIENRTHGLYEIMDGRGAHEVVVETPDHHMNMADLPVEQIERVFQAYAERTNDLESDPRLKYVLAHKNYKWTRDIQNITHSYSEIIATPIIPMRVREELNGARKYFEYHERCVFCDLIKQEIEHRERIVMEDEDFIVITPFASRFPFEMWLLPRRHHYSFAKGIAGLEKKLAKVFKEVLLRVEIGLADPAYHFVIHSAPFLKQLSPHSAKNTIPEDFHWHIELMPRLTEVAGFEKGTGFYICPIPPEEAAEYLQEVEIHERA